MKASEIKAAMEAKLEEEAEAELRDKLDAEVYRCTQEWLTENLDHYMAGNIKLVNHELREPLRTVTEQLRADIEEDLEIESDRKLQERKAHYLSLFDGTVEAGGTVDPGGTVKAK